MAVPPATLDLAAQLGDAYRAAESELNARLRAILLDERRGAERARLRELIRDVERRQTDLVREAQRWIDANLPSAYRGGMNQAISTGIGSSAFTQGHRDAIGLIASDTYADVLKVTNYMSRDLKTLIREIGREATSSKLITGRTAIQGGRDLRARLLDRGISAVTYADGRNVRASTYAEMLMRTKSAIAYNMGGLNVFAQSGVGFVELIDNPDCGLTTHQDGQKANGLIVSLEVASTFSISHPNCVRDHAPRPDITDASQADIGDMTDELQARAEDSSTASYLKANSRELRSTSTVGRQPREPRTPRTERVPQSQTPSRADRSSTSQPTAPAARGTVEPLTGIELPPGVELDLHSPKSAPDVVSVSLIRVAESARGGGLARSTMEALTAWADEHHVSLALTPDDAFGSSTSKLTKFYRSLGFKPNKGSGRELRVSESMIRRPQ